jgi:ornithine cyclodeaminase/alanine dehydrogenase-like protein (mu-crystallin family)
MQDKPSSGLNLKSPLFVSAQATRQVLVWGEVVASLREAYSVPHGPKVSPPRVVARGDRTWLRALAAVPPKSRYMGAKIFGAGRQGMVTYLIALFEQETGVLAGLVDANLVTAYRTGATSAVAVDRIEPKSAISLAVLGSGLEAQSHVRAIASIRKVEALKVYSTTVARREAFADAFAKELGVRCTAVSSPEAAVADTDVVVAAARSHDETPVLLGRWLRPGMLVVSIGSTLPEQREIDEEVVARCDLIVCDMVDEVIAETGDMMAAKKAGVVFHDKMVSLNAVLSGLARDRVAGATLPMFKSVGAAIQDVVVAELALTKAIAQGLTTGLDAPFLVKHM